MSVENRRLLDFVSDVAGESMRKIEETLGDGYVRLHISEAERRQAKHDVRCVEDVIVELLRNSRDAGASKIFIASNRTDEVRSLVVIDDGIGIPHTMHLRILEPRVTSKLETMIVDRWGVHGRGMALYSIKANVTNIEVCGSSTGLGCSIALEVDTTVLPEKTDQSTWPVVEVEEQGAFLVTKGAHNIVRRVVEFACEHPALDIYFGSPAEIAATTALLYQQSTDNSGIILVDDPELLPVWQRPGSALNAGDLVTSCSSIGLRISERTAHRILIGEMPPLLSVLEVIQASEQEISTPSETDIYKDRRGLRIHHDDMLEFRRSVTAAFDFLAERYFFFSKTEPLIRVTKDSIHVRFDIEKED